MEDKLSIRVNIAERFYALNIKRADEEKTRAAAKILNDRLLLQKQKHTDKDVQDWLAMVGLFFSLKVIENEQGAAVDGMRDLDQKLSEYLEYVMT